MEYFVVSVLNGVVHGLLLFMVSAGLTLIFGMMGVLNFAHAWFYMLGAYVGFTLTRLVGFWFGLVAGPCRRRARRRRWSSATCCAACTTYGHAHELLLTFGLAFIIEEVIKLFYGDALVSYQMPDYMRFAAFTVFETNYPFYRLFMGMVAIGHVRRRSTCLLTRTRVGIIVRAATHRPFTVEALGHNLPAIFTGVFAGGAALAGLAGAVAGAFFPTGPNMAVDVGTLLFVVVVVGGLGSVVGALIASLMIGVFISFAVGLDVSIASLLGLVGLGPWACERRRHCHLEAVDGRQRHSLPADACRLAAASRRSDGRPAVKRTRGTVVIIVCLAALLVLPLFASPNLLNAAIKMMIAALFALAFALAMGQAGMLSFGHSAYYGLGAFAALHLMQAVEAKVIFFPTPLVPLVGGVAGALAGIVFGGLPRGARAPTSRC